MGLTTTEHQQAKRADQRRRNAAARARRAGPVHLVRVLRRDGSVLLTAQSRSEPGAAYELVEVAPGRWACSCRGFGYRGTCSHLQALGSREGVVTDRRTEGDAADAQASASHLGTRGVAPDQAVERRRP